MGCVEAEGELFREGLLLGYGFRWEVWRGFREGLHLEIGGWRGCWWLLVDGGGAFVEARGGHRADLECRVCRLAASRYRLDWMAGCRARGELHGLRGGQIPASIEVGDNSQGCENTLRGMWLWEDG